MTQRISDEQLQAWIELMETAEPRSDAALKNTLPLAVARELRGAREEKRWRKVSKELPQSQFPKHDQVQFWGPGMPRPERISVDVLCAAARRPKYAGWDIFKCYWRPLPMDLPEGE